MPAIGAPDSATNDVDELDEGAGDPAAAAAPDAAPGVTLTDTPGDAESRGPAAIPPVLRGLVREERAAFAEARVELRHEPGQPPKIDGHALVYGKWSEDLGGFRERILPGAATASLANGADVRALFNHDPNFILGRNTAGTLELDDQPKGLRYVVDPPQTPTIRDLVLGPMGRNELNQSSFQFITTQDEWREPKKDGGLWERDLIAFDLIDVSPVTFPAYPQTDVGLRARIAAELGIPIDALTQLLARALAGPPTERDASLLRDAAAVAATTHEPSPADPAWNARMKGRLQR
jgi:hypothetical protein